MPERPDLDLSRILSNYGDFMPSREEAEAMRKVQKPDDALRYDTPVRLGWGPDRWSTSMALVPVERVCHDVNGYYRELGVDWRASRKELREAYMALDGQSSARLTYVFKQLLDPITREAYDRAPAGDFFLDDYTEDDLKRRASDIAAARTRLGEHVTADDVLDEMGYVVMDDIEVDTVRAVGHDLPQQRKARQNWRYSYYAWKTKDFVQNEARLQEWQDHLSTAAARLGSTSEIAIGMTSMVVLSDRQFIIELVDGKPVIFFSTEVDPTTETAEQALTEFLDSSQFLHLPSQGDNT